MRCSFSTLVLATLAIGQAAATPFSHAHMHKKSAETSKISARQEEAPLTAADIATLTSGPLALDALGKNSYTPYPNGSWIGNDGDYTSNFFNNGSRDLILAVWGSGNSVEFIQSSQPLITISIPVGQNRTLSFAEDAVGGWGALYVEDGLNNGMINNTIGEYSFNRTYGTYDISRETNMVGSPLTIVGPTCTSDFDTCFFQCINSNAANCYTKGSYELVNCTKASGGGTGTYGDQPSGGCYWPGVGVQLTTYFFD